MERTLTILIVLLVATGLAAAQGSSCPKIYVDGPMGTGEFGEPTLYSGGWNRRTTRSALRIYGQ